MIETLSVRGLAVVEKADIAFGPGLVAVTGETGAGKSVLLSAIGLLAGLRADRSEVRAGAPQADRFVEKDAVAGALQIRDVADRVVVPQDGENGRRERAAQGRGQIQRLRVAVDGEVVEVARRGGRVVAPRDRRERAADRVRQRRVDVEVQVGEMQQRESRQLRRKARQRERLLPHADVQEFAAGPAVETRAAEGEPGGGPGPFHRAPAQAAAERELAGVLLAEAFREGSRAHAPRQAGFFAGRDPEKFVFRHGGPRGPAATRA